MIQGRFKGIKKKFKGFFKGVSWQFQLRFKEVSRVFKESVKCVPRKFQIKFQEFSRMFLQFCCCMDLIAATRAEGGLVFQKLANQFFFRFVFFLKTSID